MRAEEAIVMIIWTTAAPPGSGCAGAGDAMPPPGDPCGCWSIPGGGNAAAPKLESALAVLLRRGLEYVALEFGFLWLFHLFS